MTNFGYKIAIFAQIRSLVKHGQLSSNQKISELLSVEKIRLKNEVEERFVENCTVYLVYSTRL